MNVFSTNYDYMPVLFWTRSEFEQFDVFWEAANRPACERTWALEGIRELLLLSLMKNISQSIYWMKTCRTVLKPICLFIYLLGVCCFLTGVC